jgi:hypothetical protein
VVNSLDSIPVRIVCSVGLGAELDVAYAHVFQNIADITASGGLLGTCSLTPQMEAFRFYEDAVIKTQSPRRHGESVINSSVVSSAQGHYGDYHMAAKTKISRLWINPLMSQYWFFDLPIVAKQNHFLKHLESATTVIEAVHRYALWRSRIGIRPAEPVRLT